MLTGHGHGRAGANRKLGLDDKLFVLADSVLVTGLGRIALMPCLVLAARICPEACPLANLLATPILHMHMKCQRSSGSLDSEDSIYNMTSVCIIYTLTLIFNIEFRKKL
jgi:hypothetical protein